MENIYLIGFMGVGKSVIGINLQKRLQWERIDTDARIVEREGMSIRDIFAAHGEHYFRDAETSVLRELGECTDRIVSCGGGIVLREENIDILKRTGRTVLLVASPETILARVSHRHGRPLLEGRQTLADIEEMLAARRPYYEKAADITVRSDEFSPYATAARIQKLLGIPFTPHPAVRRQ